MDKEYIQPIKEIIPVFPDILIRTEPSSKSIHSSSIPLVSANFKTYIRILHDEKYYLAKCQRDFIFEASEAPLAIIESQSKFVQECFHTISISVVDERTHALDTDQRSGKEIALEFFKFP